MIYHECSCKCVVTCVQISVCLHVSSNTCVLGHVMREKDTETLAEVSDTDKSEIKHIALQMLEICDMLED